MIKAIFFDIDGTLLSHKSKGIPQSTVAAFQELRKKGILLFAATGRHMLEMENLPLDPLEFDGYITLNGQLNLDVHKNIIDENPIHSEDVDVMIDVFNGKEIPIMIVERNKMYINFVDDQVRAAQEVISTPVPDVDLYRGEKVYSFVIYDRDHQAAEIQKRLPHCTMVYWGNDAIDVIPRDGGKSIGIQHVIEKLGIKREEMMAFGDGQNDIDMLQFAGIGVAMGNASEEVKKEADHVTADIDEDGLALALKHFGIL